MNPFCVPFWFPDFSGSDAEISAARAESSIPDAGKFTGKKSFYLLAHNRSIVAVFNADFERKRRAGARLRRAVFPYAFENPPEVFLPGFIVFPAGFPIAS